MTKPPVDPILGLIFLAFCATHSYKVEGPQECSWFEEAMEG